ncbi:MAG TPA: hypothetical protein VFS44_11075 [Gemmatimonadaceae bacterium]|nr:hypothetical protein [Gemmatimonadaceae bacterium]
MATDPRLSRPTELEAPATGSSSPERTELAPQEEPSTPGTLFLCVILLMIVAGFWVVVYLELLHR